jgi:glyoxylase-like metal-dependent hydrolase (beta-lactamase superfamily II)
VKQLHRDDLFGWSTFDPERNLDFHGTAWIREGGNVLVDPVPMGDHDLEHLKSLGGAAWIVITNSDHERAADALAGKLWAKLAGPVAERDHMGLACDRWLADGDEVVPGLQAMALNGSKTPGELALVLSPETLICGDLVRGHVGGRLNLLPDAKLSDREQARASVRRLAEIEGIEAVLVGDGWHAFRDGRARLMELLDAST